MRSVGSVLGVGEVVGSVLGVEALGGGSSKRKVEVGGRRRRS